MYFTALAFVGACLLYFEVLWPFMGEVVQRATSGDERWRIVLITEGLWLPLCGLVDYVNLLKTRSILGYLHNRQSLKWWWFPPVVAVDFVVSTLLFIASTTLIVTSIKRLAGNFMGLHWEPLLQIFPQVLTGRMFADFRVFLLVSLVPSAWLWLYVVATLATRLLLRGARLVRMPRWLLDVDKAPFRSAGIVASGLGLSLCAADGWIASIVATFDAPSP